MKKDLGHGVTHDGAWQLRRVVRTTTNGASFVRTTGCSGLEDQGGCSYLVSTLCVRCLDPVEHASCDTR